MPALRNAGTYKIYFIHSEIIAKNISTQHFINKVMESQIDVYRNELAE